MKSWRFFFILLLCCFHVDVVIAAFKSDSLYIKPFSIKISTRAFVGIKELSIEISNSSKLMSSNPKVVYKPNNGIIGGVGLSYRKILISYYFKISGTELNEREYGKTTIMDYQLNLTNRYFYFSIFNRTYSGLYVSNPFDTYPNWQKGLPLPQRPDILHSIQGVESIINLNPRKHSLNASLKLTEQQVRNVFSGLIYANYTLTSVQGDSSLIPYHLKSSFFDGRELYYTKILGWSFMPGVSYVMVNRRWFVNPMFFTGLGYSYKELFFKNEVPEVYHDYYIRINGRINCGYNSRLFFAGVFLEWNKMFFPEEGFIIRTGNFNAMLMLGFRF